MAQQQLEDIDDVKELSELADQMFKSMEKKNVNASAPKKAKKPADPAAPPKAKKPASPKQEKQFELFPSLEDAVSSQNGRKVSSIDQVISLSAAATQDSDAIRMEIVALKPVGKLFMLRQLKDPSKPVLSSFKKLGHAEVKVNKERKDGSFFILKKLAAAQKKKKIEKAKAEKPNGEAKAKKQKKQKPDDSRKNLNEKIEKLKKKTVARAPSGQKMAVTASEVVVAQGSA